MMTKTFLVLSKKEGNLQKWKVYQTSDIVKDGRYSIKDVTEDFSNKLEIINKEYTYNVSIDDGYLNVSYTQGSSPTSITKKIIDKVMNNFTVYSVGNENIIKVTSKELYYIP